MTAAESGAKPEEEARRSFVLVTVGTDHHPFARLVGWADAWARENPEARVLVQYGSASPPEHAEGASVLAYGDLKRCMREADVVVTQGGPAGIVDAREAGRLPIVVPRVSGLGEHVDDHQVAFATHMSGHGRVVLATDEASFAAALDRALSDPPSFAVPPEQAPPTAATADRMDQLLSALVARPRPRLWRARRSDDRAEDLAGHSVAARRPDTARRSGATSSRPRIK